MVVVKYDGSKQPDHLRKVYRFKGFQLDHGAAIEMPEAIAGHLVATAPAGSVKVVSGEVIPWSPVSPSVKLAVRTANARASVFPRDATGVLDEVRALPKAILAVLAKAEADVIAFLAEGKGDAHLGNIAVWAQLGGKSAIAVAASKRASAVAAAAKAKAAG